MIQEFRDFINRGNVVDLAVAVVIGAAFAPIITSLVNDIIMPPLGLFLGRVDFSALGIILGDADAYASVPAALEAGAPVIAYGRFINTLVQFLITAFAIFMVVRYYSRIKQRWERQQDTAPEEAPAPSREELLLTEIRDILAQRGA